MEIWLPFAITAVGLVFTAILAYNVGKREGRQEYEEKVLNELSSYRATSQPTQQSGTHTPERGSDDTE